MEVVNATPYVLLPFDYSPAPSMPALSLIVKGTFALRPDQPAVAVDKAKQRQIMADDVHMDDIGRSLRYASDLVPIKVRGEVLVHAVCYTPDGRPRTSCDVSIAVGPIQKALRITGDRAWSRDAQGQPIVGRTQPFESMPIRWERAFGGLSSPHNPLGRGIEPWPDDAGKLIHYLPNIEPREKRVADPAERPPPVGLGPISPMWEPRLSQQGTRDQRWAMFRAPLPPKNFDPRFFNAAPEDQQLAEGYFWGDEPIVMTGLHKEIPVYRTSLPGKRLRVFLLIRQPKGAPSRFTEVHMNLDTVHIDMEAEQLVLAWRRPIMTKSVAHPEIEACYVTEEDLASEALSPEAHEARFRELRGPQDPPLGAAAAKEIEEQTAEAKRILRESNADPNVVAKIEQMKDPQEIFKALMDYAKEQIGEIERMTATFKAPPGV